MLLLILLFWRVFIWRGIDVKDLTSQCGRDLWLGFSRLRPYWSLQSFWATRIQWLQHQSRRTLIALFSKLPLDRLQLSSFWSFPPRGRTFSRLLLKFQGISAAFRWNGRWRIAWWACICWWLLLSLIERRYHRGTRRGWEARLHLKKRTVCRIIVVFVAILMICSEI